jgi:tetratricopeptide (TPR) repeat protein
MGSLEEGLRALREALRLTASIGELGSPSEIVMLVHAAGATHGSGQFADSLLYLERALRAAERLGDPSYTAWVLSFRGIVHLYTGDWEAARTDLERAVALHRRLGLTGRAAWAIGGLGWLHLLEGAWEEAGREAEEAIAIADHSGFRHQLLTCHDLLARLDIRQGQPAAARARLLPLLEQQDMRRQLLHFVLPRLAWAQLELGETSEAAALVSQVVDYAREAWEPVLLAEILWLQALVAIRQEDWEEAQRALEEGIALAHSLPYPYMEARSLWVYGLMHLQKGEPEPARERLEAALAIFRRLGARKDAEQVDRDLASLQQQPLA